MAATATPERISINLRTDAASRELIDRAAEALGVEGAPPSRWPTSRATRPRSRACLHGRPSIARGAARLRFYGLVGRGRPKYFSITHAGWCSSGFRSTDR